MKRRIVPLIKGDVVRHAPDTPEDLISIAEMTGEAPELDLHGFPVDQAVAEMETFLRIERKAGTRVVKIIHGKGTGALQAAVLRTCKKQKEIQYYRPALEGIGGAIYIVFSEDLRK